MKSLIVKVVTLSLLTAAHSSVNASEESRFNKEAALYGAIGAVSVLVLYTSVKWAMTPRLELQHSTTTKSIPYNEEGTYISKNKLKEIDDLREKAGLLETQVANMQRQLDELLHKDENGHSRISEGLTQTSGQPASAVQMKTPERQQSEEHVLSSPLKVFTKEDEQKTFTQYQLEVKNPETKIKVSERIFDEFLNTDDKNNKPSRSLMAAIREIKKEAKESEVFFDIKTSKSNWCMLEYTINDQKAEKRVVFK